MCTYIKQLAALRVLSSDTQVELAWALVYLPFKLSLGSPLTTGSCNCQLFYTIVQNNEPSEMTSCLYIHFLFVCLTFSLDSPPLIPMIQTLNTWKMNTWTLCRYVYEHIHIISTDSISESRGTYWKRMSADYLHIYILVKMVCQVQDEHWTNRIGLIPVARSSELSLTPSAQFADSFGISTSMSHLRWHMDFNVK